MDEQLLLFRTLFLVSSLLKKSPIYNFFFFSNPLKGMWSTSVEPKILPGAWEDFIFIRIVIVTN